MAFPYSIITILLWDMHEGRGTHFSSNLCPNGSLKKAEIERKGDLPWPLIKNIIFLAVIVAQLVERLLPTQEVGCSNRVISKFCIGRLFPAIVLKEENKEKEVGKCPFKN